MQSARKRLNKSSDEDFEAPALGMVKEGVVGIDEGEYVGKSISFSETKFKVSSMINFLGLLESTE